MRIFTEQEIMDTYTQYVHKTPEYFQRYSNINTVLTPEEKIHWVGKDAPRLFSILDFRSWIKKYEIQVNNLFYTCETDPELQHLNYKQKHLCEYVYPGKNDLHLLKDDTQYDFILFNQTLEHLYNPFIAVKNLYNILENGGYLYTTVPIVNIPHGILGEGKLMPFHFWGITSIGLCMLMKSAGFNILECGLWGNFKYISRMFGSQEWPDFQQVANENGIVENNPVCQAQTWVLARK